MQQQEMIRLIDIHLAAEQAADSGAAVSVYTPDVEHDVVGMPEGVMHGKDAAQKRYEEFYQGTRVEEMRPVRQYYGDDFCVMEHVCTATVPGSLLGVPGHGRRVSFRILHVWDFSDGQISRENVWLDGAAIVSQLTASREPD
jgi:steroid delta-isomerase-like uncharacterized protein